MIKDFLNDGWIEVDSRYSGFQRITYGDNSITSLGVKIPACLYNSYYNLKEDREFSDYMFKRIKEYNDEKEEEKWIRDNERVELERSFLDEIVKVVEKNNRKFEDPIEQFDVLIELEHLKRLVEEHEYELQHRFDEYIPEEIL